MGIISRGTMNEMMKHRSRRKMMLAISLSIVLIHMFATTMNLETGHEYDKASSRRLNSGGPTELTKSNAESYDARIEGSKKRVYLHDATGRGGNRMALIRERRRRDKVRARREARRQARQKARGDDFRVKSSQIEHSRVIPPPSSIDASPLSICGRHTATNFLTNLELRDPREDAPCPATNVDEHGNGKIMILLEGHKTYGRTGNNLIEFLHALDYARELGASLGIARDSWATRVITQMWLADDIPDNIPDEATSNNSNDIYRNQWIQHFENKFCVVIIQNESQLQDYQTVLRMETRDLFVRPSQQPLREYIRFTAMHIRSLFRSYNNGMGYDARHRPVADMCSGINALFPDNSNSNSNNNKNDSSSLVSSYSTPYSVIHSRHLEGPPGYKLLKRISLKSGCDPEAALHMEPNYVKSILRPLGMLHHPIVFITDGQTTDVYERLINDDEIGPQLRLVPPEDSWLGGDMTLAIMANVFIGNPASTFSGFIVKSRISLGFGNNYLFRARNNPNNNDRGDKYTEDWITTCPGSCVFDKHVMNSMA